MSRLLVPTLGPSDWRRLLANPSTQWVRGKSAYVTAVAWEAARTTPRGLPLQVCQILDTHDDLRGAVLLLGIPEHRVYLPGGGHASQTDLWALLRKEDHLISLAVEGKSGESFDKTVGEWLTSAKPNSRKPSRLAFLRERLGLSHVEVTRIRYQLLHRTAAALLEAERFTADFALVLIQSFGGQNDASSFSDFQAFGRLFDLELNLAELSEAKVPGKQRLLLGWVACQAAKERDLAAAI